MARKPPSQKDVVNQLIQDKERYRTHPNYWPLICFVYDPAGQCTSPQALENDLTKNHDNLNVIVIVQPKHH